MDFAHIPLPPGITASVEATPRIRIRIARTEEHIRQAVAVRYQAYAEKLTGLASDVATKEDLDRTLDPVILLAENLDRSQVIATARLNSGPGVRDLLAQVDMPPSYEEDRLGYFSRMAAVGHPGEKKIARGLLHKALLQICMAKQIDRMLLLVGNVRSKLYMPWGFKPVFPDGVVCPEIVHGRPVKLYQLETRKAEQKALEIGGPLYDFLFRTLHQEIEIFNSLSSIPNRSEPIERIDRLESIEMIERFAAAPLVVQGPPS